MIWEYPCCVHCIVKRPLHLWPPLIERKKERKSYALGRELRKGMVGRSMRVGGKKERKSYALGRELRKGMVGRSMRVGGKKERKSCALGRVLRKGMVRRLPLTDE